MPIPSDAEIIDRAYNECKALIAKLDLVRKLAEDASQSGPGWVRTSAIFAVLNDDDPWSYDPQKDVWGPRSKLREAYDRSAFRDGDENRG